MKRHLLYRIAALAMILSVVMFGCAEPAPLAAPEEPVAEAPAEAESAETESDKEEPIGVTNGPKYYSYKEQGVLIVTPAGYFVEPTDVGSLPAEQPEFPDLKVLFSFDLYHEGGNKVSKGETTDIRVWVRWQADDTSPEGETPPELVKPPPELVIFWGEDPGWQAARDLDDHAVKYHPPDFRAWGGVASLHITKWGGDDPGIGWAD